MTPDQKSKMIANIRSSRFSDAELINLYSNASAQGEVEMMDIIKVQMRADFPKAASRKFGAKETDAIVRLENVLSELPQDLMENRLKNGVKSGGQMLSGEKHIDVYISYKNDSRVGAFLGLLQDNPKSELIARVGYYKTGEGAFRDEKSFSMDEFEMAINLYKTYLSKVRGCNNA